MLIKDFLYNYNKCKQIFIYKNCTYHLGFREKKKQNNVWKIFCIARLGINKSQSELTGHRRSRTKEQTKCNAGIRNKTFEI